MPENRKRIGIFEASDALESEARDVAEAQLLEEQAKLNGPKLFDTKDPNYHKLDLAKSWEQIRGLPQIVKRVWKYNLFGTATRHNRVREVRDEMIREGSIHGSGEKSADMEARHAVADRLVNNIFQCDEAKEMSEGVGTEIEAEIRALIHRFARGASISPTGEVVGAMTDNEFDTQRRAILGEYASEKESSVSRGIRKVSNYVSHKLNRETFSDAQEAAVRYADNMTLVAKEIRNAVAHGEGIDALVDELEFVKGKAKMGARTEAKYNFFDKGMRFLRDKVPLGSLISETSVSLAVAATYSVITSGAVWSGRRALALIGGAGAAGALTGAITERLKFTEERQLVAREMAKGKQFNPDNAPRRKELAGTFIEPKQASEFMDPLEALFEDVDGVRMLSLTVTQDQLREAMATLSDLQARREMMDRFEKEDNRVDLIAYSDGKSLEKERSELFKLQADAEVAIKALLRSNVHEHLGPEYDPATLDYKIADHVNGREFLNETEILQAIEDARVEALAAGKDPSDEDVMNDSLASQLENLRNVKGFAVAPIESAYEKNFAIPHLKREEKRRESYHRWDTSQASKILKNIKLKKDLFEIKHFNSEAEVDAYMDQLKKTQEQVVIVDDLGSMEDKQRLFEKMRANKSWVAARNGFIAGTVIGGLMTGVKPLMGWLSGWFHDHIPGGHGHTMILPTDSYHSGEVSLPAGLELHPRNLASGRVIWDMFKDGKEVAHGLVQHETGRFGLVTEDGAIGDIDSAWGKLKGGFSGGKDLNEILKENNIRMTEVSERYHFGDPNVAGTTTVAGHGTNVAGAGAGIGRVVDAVRHAGDPLNEGLPTSGPEIHLEAERNLSWTEWLAKVKENPATVKEFGIRHIAHRGWGDNDTPMHDVSESHGAGRGMHVDDKLSEKLYTHADSPARPHILSHEVNGSEHVMKYNDGTEVKFDPTKSLRDHRISVTHGSSHVDGVREYKLSDGRTLRIDPSARNHFTVSRESVGGNSAVSYDNEGQPIGLSAKGAGLRNEDIKYDEAGQPILSQKQVHNMAGGELRNEDIKYDENGQPILDQKHAIDEAHKVIAKNEEVLNRFDASKASAREALRRIGADGYETRLMDPVEKNGKILYVLKGLKLDDSFHGSHHVRPMAEAGAGKLRMLFSFGSGAKDVIEVPAHLDGHGNAVAEIAKGSNLDKILHDTSGKGIKRLYENVEAAVVENDTDPKGAHIFTVATDPNHHKGGWKLPGFKVTEPEPVTPTPPTETPPVPPTETPNPGTETEPKHMRFGTRNTTIFDYTEPQWEGPRIWPIPMRDRDPLEASTAPVPRATRARGARGGVGGGGAGTGTPSGGGGGAGPGATGPGTTAGAGPTGPGTTGPTGPGTTAGSGPGSTTGAGPGASGPTGPGSAAGAGPKGPTGPGADPRLSKPPFDWESDPRVGTLGTRDPKQLNKEKEAHKKQYRRAAKLVHPDKFTTGDPMRVRAESLWKYLDQAYREGNWAFFDDLYDIVIRDYDKPKTGAKTAGAKTGKTGPVGGGAGAGSAKGAGPSATGPGTATGTGPGATGPSAASAGGPAGAGSAGPGAGTGPGATAGSGPGTSGSTGPGATGPTGPGAGPSGPDTTDSKEKARVAEAVKRGMAIEKEILAEVKDRVAKMAGYLNEEKEIYQALLRSAIYDWDKWEDLAEYLGTQPNGKETVEKIDEAVRQYGQQKTEERMRLVKIIDADNHRDDKPEYEARRTLRDNLNRAYKDYNWREFENLARAAKKYYGAKVRPDATDSDSGEFHLEEDETTLEDIALDEDRQEQMVWAEDALRTMASTHGIKDNPEIVRLLKQLRFSFDTKRDWDMFEQAIKSVEQLTKSRAPHSRSGEKGGTDDAKPTRSVADTERRNGERVLRRGKIFYDRILAEVDEMVAKSGGKLDTDKVWSKHLIRFCLTDKERWNELAEYFKAKVDNGADIVRDVEEVASEFRKMGDMPEFDSVVDAKDDEINRSSSEIIPAEYRWDAKSSPRLMGIIERTLRSKKRWMRSPRDLDVTFGRLLSSWYQTAEKAEDWKKANLGFLAKERIGDDLTKQIDGLLNRKGLPAEKEAKELGRLVREAVGREYRKKIESAVDDAIKDNADERVRYIAVAKAIRSTLPENQLEREYIVYTNYPTEQAEHILDGIAGGASNNALAKLGKAYIGASRVTSNKDKVVPVKREVPVEYAWSPDEKPSLEGAMEKAVTLEIGNKNIDELRFDGFDNQFGKLVSSWYLGDEGKSFKALELPFFPKNFFPRESSLSRGFPTDMDATAIGRVMRERFADSVRDRIRDRALKVREENKDKSWKEKDEIIGRIVAEELPENWVAREMVMRTIWRENDPRIQPIQEIYVDGLESGEDYERLGAIYGGARSQSADRVKKKTDDEENIVTGAYRNRDHKRRMGVESRRVDDDNAVGNGEDKLSDFEGPRVRTAYTTRGGMGSLIEKMKRIDSGEEEGWAFKTLLETARTSEDKIDTTILGRNLLTMRTEGRMQWQLLKSELAEMRGGETLLDLVEDITNRSKLSGNKRERELQEYRNYRAIGAGLLDVLRNAEDERLEALEVAGGNEDTGVVADSGTDTAGDSIEDATESVTPDGNENIAPEQVAEDRREPKSLSDLIEAEVSRLERVGSSSTRLNEVVNRNLGNKVYEAFQMGGPQTSILEENIGELRDREGNDRIISEGILSLLSKPNKLTEKQAERLGRALKQALGIPEKKVIRRSVRKEP